MRIVIQNIHLFIYSASYSATATYEFHVVRCEIVDIGSRLWRCWRWRAAHATMNHLPPPTCTTDHTHTYRPHTHREKRPTLTDMHRERDRDKLKYGQPAVWCTVELLTCNSDKLSGKYQYFHAYHGVFSTTIYDPPILSATAQNPVTNKHNDGGSKWHTKCEQPPTCKNSPFSFLVAPITGKQCHQL